MLDDAEAVVIARPHGQHEFAICIKTAVQTAICIQADEAEITVAAVDAVPGHNQLAIALLNDTETVVITRPYDRSDFAIGIKTGV